ncbi:MAG: hypothetical protein Q4D85_11260 [Corynebacterium sp.]|uniref:hypothetical protein n=1 Tax=Corynebacterium sp. TaxID=1720 RepID=UPI0026DBC806|nr:hypothetical protein [Corynebacterium sp.]MDO5099313.1 hypothetical protein [Corynebacterium sp.]
MANIDIIKKKIAEKQQEIADLKEQLRSAETPGFHLGAGYNGLQLLKAPAGTVVRDRLGTEYICAGHPVDTKQTSWVRLGRQLSHGATYTIIYLPEAEVPSHA